MPPFKSFPEPHLLLCFNEELGVLTDIWSRVFSKLKNYYKNVRLPGRAEKPRDGVEASFPIFLPESKMPSVYSPLRTADSNKTQYQQFITCIVKTIPTAPVEKELLQWIQYWKAFHWWQSLFRLWSNSSADSLQQSHPQSSLSLLLHRTVTQHSTALTLTAYSNLQVPRSQVSWRKIRKIPFLGGRGHISFLLNYTKSNL